MGRPNFTQSVSLRVVAAAVMAGCVSATIGADVPQRAGTASPPNWCQVQPGHTKAQVVAIMGPPQYTFPAQMSWTVAPYHFVAFFDSDGNVKQLDSTFTPRSPAEKSTQTCGDLRTKRSVAAAAAGATVAKAPPVHSSLRACAMVTEAEMSAILGAPVVAQTYDRFTGKTECIYKSKSGIAPYVELSIEWGDGRGAMAGMGLARKKEPGVASPYDGIGDEAGIAGPAIMIRTGDDLVKIVLSGVPDALAKAKRIFETAKRKM